MIIETLLFPYRKQLLALPGKSSQLLFLNAVNTPELKRLSIVPVQPRHDLALPFITAGLDVTDDAGPQHSQRFDTVWLLPGKGLQETQYLLAQAVTASKNGGTIVAAAPNNAGGKRLKDMFEELGLSPSDESKNKARVVFSVVGEEYDQKKAAEWIAQGQEQAIMRGTFLSRPGLHSWDKPDNGSELLVRHLPDTLSGTVADFGCGWGYLSLCAAKKSSSIARLTLIDVDARAVSLAKRNIQKHHPSLPVDTVWADLSRPDIKLGPFDTILLNPPFHEGTHAVPALGQAIITTAARALALSGTLYLVANQHLPYEKTLHGLFSRVTPLAEELGFKIFVCQL